MKKLFMICAVIASMMVLQGCQRIETGEVGLRVGYDKQVNMTELNPGSFNQTIIGSVLTFPVRDIAIELNDMKAQTLDGSTLSDFDVTVIYSISPSAAGELYTTKSKTFHANTEDGDTLLMYNYMTTLARTAAYKAVAKYPALESVKKRDSIEADTTTLLMEALKAEKLDAAITITKVQVRAVQPAASIIAAANEAIAAKNQLVTKLTQVDIAKAESARQEWLSKPANLEYMRVQAQLNISEGVRDGKVQTILLPHGMTMYGNGK